MTQSCNTAFLTPTPLLHHRLASTAVSSVTVLRSSRRLLRAQVSPSGDPSAQTDFLKRLEKYPDHPSPTRVGRKSLESSGQPVAAFQYFRNDLFSDIETLLSPPLTLISSAVISILFGFFSATSASTIIGSVADWDPLAAAVLLVWTEGFTKKYYSTEKNQSFCSY